jgi:MFS family permease
MRLPPGVANLCTVQFVDVLGGTVVVTALPTMLADLGAAPSASSLVVTGYAMFFGGLLVLGARAGDRYGHRRVLQSGIVLFGLASLLAAVAPSIVLLVGARCLQGAAAAASVPAALRLITAVAAEGEDRRRSLALWSASGAAAGASGFVLGGFVTQWASWRAIFWGMLVLAGVLLVAIRRAVPAGRGDPAQRLDVPGAAVLTGSVMALVVGAALAPSWIGVVLVVAGLALVPALAAVERHARVPLLPAAAVRNGNLRAGAAGSFLNTAGTSSTATLATLHLQDVDRLSAVGAGLLLLPFSLAVVAGAPLAARALRRWRPRSVIAAGLGLIAAANLVLVASGGAVGLVPVGMVLGGLGIGLSSVAATGLGTSVPAALQGVASGVLNTAAQLGTALGVAAILLVAGLAGGGSGPSAGAVAGWLAAGLLAAAGALLFRLGPDPTRPTGRFRPHRPGRVRLPGRSG